MSMGLGNPVRSRNHSAILSQGRNILHRGSIRVFFCRSPRMSVQDRKRRSRAAPSVWKCNPSWWKCKLSCTRFPFRVQNIFCRREGGYFCSISPRGSTTYIPPPKDTSRDPQQGQRVTLAIEGSPVSTYPEARQLSLRPFPRGLGNSLQGKSTHCHPWD